jgi:hypothetical protein
MNMYKHRRTDKVYLEDQNELDTLIKSVVQDASDELTECWEGREVEPIECMSRDGFIANTSNCGGYEYKGFTTVDMIVGSGNYPTSKEARKQIDRQYELNEQHARESLQSEFITYNIPQDKQNYHDLYELGYGRLAERLSESVSERSADDTIMYSLRIMYGGKDESGVHTAWVSAAVNWESPYHRQSISWMSGYKCEHAKEIEVTFKTLTQAKKKLVAAMKKTMKEII